MPNFILDFLSPEHVEQFAFVLIHSLWQASLVAGVLWLALRRFSAEKPGWRYGISSGAMLLVVLSAVLTWSVLEYDFSARSVIQEGGTRVSTKNQIGGSSKTSSNPSQTKTQTSNQKVADTENVSPSAAGDDASSRSDSPITVDSKTSSTTTRSGSEENFNEKENERAKWTWTVAAVWCCGTLLMFLRLMFCVGSARRLMKSSTPLEDSAVQMMAKQLQTQLGLSRRIRIVVCERIDVPAVLGVIRPVVLIPPSLLTGIPADQLRVILAHELAHARRYDYLVNLLQMFVEAVWFFNPAVWWISRQIRIERESCCDQLAVEITGQRMTVARTLVDFADTLTRPAPSPHVAPVLAGSGVVQGMGGDRSSSSLFQRIRRIVVPREHPHIRLPWYSLVGLLIAGLVVLAGLEQGSRLVVKVAAQVLSPQERIEKLTEIEKTHGKREESRKEPQGKFTITGRVVTEDGEPLPEKINSHSYYRRPGYSATASLNIDENGRFSEEFRLGTVHLHVKAPGYATAIVGPLTAETGETIDDVEIVLSRGFSAPIRFVDEEGEPIPNVVLERVVYVFETDGGITGVHFSQDDFPSPGDEQGMVTLEKSAKWPLRIEVRRKGYQFDRRKLTPKPGKTFDWTLKKARPVTGKVVSEEDGKPIEGARLYLAQRDGFAPYGTDPRPLSEKEPMAVSDSEGRFRLASLRDDCRYLFFVDADGHGLKILRDVRAGQTDRTVRLGPPLEIRGTLIGKLDELDTRYRSKKPYFTYRNPIKMLDGGRYSDIFRVEVDVQDGRGTFEIDDLLPGAVRLFPLDRTIELEMQESIDDLEIDLTQPPKKAVLLENLPRRTVVLRFSGLEENIPPRGQLRVGFHHDKLSQRKWRDKNIDVTSNKVEVEAPVGSRLFYDGDELVGYWIDNKSNIEVPAGEEPLEITIPVKPAGAVYGRVLEADGSPVDEFQVHVITVEKPPGLKTSLMENQSVRNAEGRFVFSRLPLGGRYRILARKTDTQARSLSPILDFNEQQSIHRIQLQFAEGVTVKGKVLGPEGDPESGVTVSFGYSAPHGHNFGGPSTQTDRKGQFRFQEVNPDLPGSYSLTIRPTDSFAGHYRKIDDLTEPVTFRLKEGQRLIGKVIDAETSKPVAEQRLYVIPADYDEVQYRSYIDTNTDENGRFEFGVLEDAHYRLNASGNSEIVSVRDQDGNILNEEAIRPSRDKSITVTIRKR